MTIKNTEDSYGLVTQLLHWIVGVMIVSMIIVGFSMQNIEDPVVKQQIYASHKAIGVMVLLLVSIRLLWRLINIRVILPSDLPRWQKNAATLNINILYLLMFIMPISGVLMTILSGRNIDIYGLFTITSFIQNALFAKIFYKMHEFSAFILCALIALHTLAAFYHHFVRKDDVLKRMWFNNRNN
ncbi:MAG: cytochrome b [Candidatus Tisiphia sp.]